MEVPFYDNCNQPLEEDPSLIEVERIYCFEFNSFTDAHWESLVSIYSKLPEFKEMNNNGPMWFGTKDEEIPFLWASVEPPGLQVYGVLKADQWIAWDEAFRANTNTLPFRSDIP